MSVRPTPKHLALPEHLASPDAQGFAPGEPIAQYELGSYRNFVYLILDWESRRAAIVDPQSDLARPLADLKNHQFKLERILLTHTHHDHVAGVPELTRMHPELPVHCGEKDAHRIQGRVSGGQLALVKDGETLSLGGISIRALHTPGHSAGEICYFLTAGSRPYVFTGDTLFIRDCGRTDFPDGSNTEMFASLQRIKNLPPDTVVLCGHHYQMECATTLAQELEQSPPLRVRSVEELAALP